jgi:hypothetical protein
VLSSGRQFAQQRIAFAYREVVLPHSSQIVLEVPAGVCPTGLTAACRRCCRFDRVVVSLCW